MITIKEFFGNIVDSKALSDACVSGRVLSLDTDRKENRVEMYVSYSAFVPYTEIMTMAQLIAKKTGIGSMSIVPSFPKECFNENVMPSLVERIREEDASINGTFKDAFVTYNGSVLSAELNHGGAELLDKKNVRVKMQRLIKEWFDVDCAVKFTGKLKVGSVDESSIGRIVHEEEKKVREAKIEEMELYEAKMKEEAAKRNISVREGKALYPMIIPETMKPLIGNVTKKEIIPISEIHPDSGSVKVWGDIFDIESKETRDKSKVIYSIDITDYTGSITLKFIEEAGKTKDLESLSKGDSIIVYGELSYDKYDRENVIRQPAIAKVDKVKVVDTCPEKRVELHMHTNMSDMDGMAPAGDLIKRAEKWGWKAVAITDHGVAQAFPEAMNTYLKLKKAGSAMKIIYGVESYFVNDLVPAIKGNIDRNIDGEYICFDLETTGLSNKMERITEIGAVKIRNGEIVDKFSSFVNPEKDIPAKITELTGITNEMVKAAPYEAEALKAFYEFCGENPVFVAHNADFDVSFLRAAGERTGIPFNYTYIDTVSICRSMLKDIKNCKLDTVAKYLKLPEFNHHRAVDDANILGEIFKCLLVRFKEDLKISDLSELNTSLAGGDPKKLPSYHQIILVKNLTGLKNLYKIISEGHLTYYFKRPRTPRSYLDAHREGLIIGSACEAGELFRAMIKGEPFDELCRIADYYDYLEIQPIGNNMFMVRNGECDEEQLREYNRTIVRIGEKLGKPVVATGDVHFLEPHDASFRAILMAG
ncbi:MAG: PHP domain-containing protein, partial [Clostridia bacterium]|nr:PHP domain-containing protein [Clostridia bacterium]